MINTDELPNCCAVGLLSNFYEYGPLTSLETKKQLILNEIQDFLSLYLEEDTDYPTTFFATTNTKQQQPWEEALKAVGFKARKFRSRHDKGTEKSLNFWSLYSIPKELKPWLKTEVKQMKAENW